MPPATHRPASEDAPHAASEDVQHTASEDAQHTAPEEVPLAECVLCGEPTEYPESTPGIVLCPVCEWQEAQRTACSG